MESVTCYFRVRSIYYKWIKLEATTQIIKIFRLFSCCAFWAMGLVFGDFRMLCLPALEINPGSTQAQGQFHTHGYLIAGLKNPIRRKNISVAYLPWNCFFLEYHRDNALWVRRFQLAKLENNIFDIKAEAVEMLRFTKENQFSWRWCCCIDRIKKMFQIIKLIVSNSVALLSTAGYQRGTARQRNNAIFTVMIGPIQITSIAS